MHAPWLDDREIAGPQLGGPGARLDRVLLDIGTSMLAVLAGDGPGSRMVGGVVIHDPDASGPVPQHAIHLGVGVRDLAQVRAAAENAQRCGGAALVVRDDIEIDSGLAELIANASMLLLGLRPGIGWHELMTALERSIAQSEAPQRAPEFLGGFAAGDLFEMANAICALIDAPITIQDRRGPVLAFSDRQDERDYIRVHTILLRRVPDEILKIDEESGAMHTIRRSREPVFLEAMDLGDDRPSFPRVAVAIRAGDEMLGIIWAIVMEPLSAERNQMLLDASRLVALHLLHLRASAAVEKRALNERISDLVLGGERAVRSARHLGFDEAPCAVVVASNTNDIETASDLAALSLQAADRQQLANALAVHLGSLRPGSVVGELRDAVYAVIPARGAPESVDGIETLCNSFAERTRRTDHLLIGIGRVATGADEIATSRADAERALAVLRAGKHRVKVARAEEVEDEAIMLELRDVVKSRRAGPSGPYKNLLDYDSDHDGLMAKTLVAWLDTHGDIPTAAARMSIHKNTFRYRFRRVAEISGVDLDDPDVRFALSLQVRLFPPPDRARQRRGPR